jgi:hypothetical protein
VARRKPLPRPPDWEESDVVTINGRTVGRGTELSIRGERGRFRFLKRVTRPERGVEWLDVWGGPRHYESLRSFYPERVKRVHRINTTPENLLAARKEGQSA